MVSPPLLPDIIGTSTALAKVMMLAERGAASDIPILIEGESGVGKELIARAIHYHSKRGEMPFVPINCGAIVDNLAESIFFGHEKGAFTGAVNSAIGKFREADGGTLFLDEIGELPLHLQVKLLRALQEGEIQPVGGNKTVQVDIRIISATNRDLRQLVTKQQFREDFFYRLTTFPIHIPPLRNRPDDLICLAKYFCDMVAAIENKPIRGITPKAQELLMTHVWPGNIRELKNAVFRAVILCDGDYLDVIHFPEIIPAPVCLLEQGGDSPLALLDAHGNFKPLDVIEHDIIQAALRHYAGHITDTCKFLRISRSTFYRKIQHF